MVNKKKNNSTELIDINMLLKVVEIFIQQLKNAEMPEEEEKEAMAKTQRSVREQADWLEIAYEIQDSNDRQKQQEQQKQDTGASEDPRNEDKGAGEDPGNEDKGAGEDPGNEDKGAGEDPGNEDKGAGEDPGNGDTGNSMSPLGDTLAGGDPEISAGDAESFDSSIDAANDNSSDAGMETEAGAGMEAGAGESSRPSGPS